MAYRDQENIVQAGFRVWIEGMVGKGDMAEAGELLIDKCSRYPDQAVGAFAMVAGSRDPEVRRLAANNLGFLIDRPHSGEHSKQAAFRILDKLCRDDDTGVAVAALANLM